MDNLFEQIVNITKASAYDILVEQVKELKADNETLKQVIKDLIGELGCYDLSKETPPVIERAKAAINF
jgi:hypothetical protein